MGLLTQALAGAVQGGAMAGYKMLDDRNKANLIAERDAAQAAREENLARLRASLADEYEQSKEGRARDAKDEELNDKYTITRDDGTSFVPTNLQVRENQSDNAAVEPIFKKYAEAGKAAEDAAAKDYVEGRKPGGLIMMSNIADIRAQGAAARKMSDEDKEIVDSYDAAGKLSRHGDEVAALKQSFENEKLKAKIESELTLLQKKQEWSEKEKDRDRELKLMLAALGGGKGGSGAGSDGDKPLTADRAMDRGTALMKAARGADGSVIDSYMYDEGKKLIKWAQTKAKGGIPEDVPVPDGSFDASVLQGAGPGASDIGNLIGTAAPQSQSGPRKSKAVDKSLPVTKNGVVGYRQPDGSVLSATGKRLN